MLIPIEDLTTRTLLGILAAIDNRLMEYGGLHASRRERILATAAKRTPITWIPTPITDTLAAYRDSKLDATPVQRIDPYTIGKFVQHLVACTHGDPGSLRQNLVAGLFNEATRACAPDLCVLGDNPNWTAAASDICQFLFDAPRLTGEIVVRLEASLRYEGDTV